MSHVPRAVDDPYRPPAATGIFWAVQVRVQCGPRTRNILPVGLWKTVFEEREDPSELADAVGMSGAQRRARKVFTDEEVKGATNQSSNPRDLSWTAREIRLWRGGELKLHVHWNLR